jgi:molybdenum cofactor cytidylyltransferase
MRIGAIILAAGASRRMGRNKMLLPLDGEPLVRRAARRAKAAGCSPVIVVIGNEAEQVRAALDGVACTCVENPEFTGPTTSSLHIGLRQLPDDVTAVVVILADMVHVTDAMLRTMLETARTSEAPLVVSQYGEAIAPPLLFRRPLFAELLEWHGEGAGKQVVQRHRAEAAIVDWPSAALVDVDTPEDWARLR